MAEQQESTTLIPSFPIARVKKIVKIDKDITRISSEALHLVSGAAEIFLYFLAEKSADIATEKKRRTIKLDDLILAVKKHKPTRQFLLDSLPKEKTVSKPLDRNAVKDKAVPVLVPPHTRRIDSFFKKPVNSNRVDDIVSGRAEVDENVRVEVENHEIADRVEVEDDEIADRVEDDEIVERVEVADDKIVDRVEVEDDEIVERVEVEDDDIVDRVEVEDDEIVERVEVLVDLVEAEDDEFEERVEDENENDVFQVDED